MEYEAVNHTSYCEKKKMHAADPVEFWKKTAVEMLKWDSSEFTNVIGQIGDENSFWFDGGMLNVCYNAVDRHAESNPDKIALLYEGNEPKDVKQMTYGELKTNVCKMANVLLEHGITRGSVVSIYLPVCMESIITMLACARIGAIHSLIFGAFSGHALSYRIQNCEASIVVTAHSYYRATKPIPMLKTLETAIKDVPTVKKVLVVNLTGTDITLNDEREELLAPLMESASSECECVSMRAADPLFILYTSGSTGEPKGVIHRCGGYAVATALSFKYVFDTDANTRFGCTSDLGWITGHSYVCYGPLLNGVTTLVFGGSPLYPHAKRSWELISSLKLTHFYTSPSAVRAISAHVKSVDDVSEFDTSSLRVIGSVGETLDAASWEFIHGVIGRGKCWIVDTYWQTELGSIIATAVPGVDAQQPGVVGRPLFATELVLVDVSTNKVVASTSSTSYPKEPQHGLLCIASPWPGLTNAAYRSTKSFKESYIVPGTHFFSTGDTASIDSTGAIRITGRVDDQLCVNGHRVGPAEVEHAIDGVKGIVESAVVGVPDETTGQKIVAFVVTTRNHDDVRRDIVMGVRQSFAAIGSPSKIIFVKDLPKNNSQKILRVLLRNLMTNPSAPRPIIANPECIDDIVLAIAGEHN